MCVLIAFLLGEQGCHPQYKSSSPTSSEERCEEIRTWALLVCADWRGTSGKPIAKPSSMWHMCQGGRWRRSIKSLMGGWFWVLTLPWILCEICPIWGSAEEGSWGKKPQTILRFPKPWRILSQHLTYQRLVRTQPPFHKADVLLFLLKHQLWLRPA